MSIFSEEKLKITQIWLIATKLYKKAFIHILPLGILSGLVLIFSTISNIVSPISFDVSDFDLARAAPPIITALATLYLTSLFIVKYYNLGNGEEVNWKKVLVTVTKKYPIVILASSLALGLGALGFIALIAPGIFLFVLLAMAQPLVLLDNNGIIESIKNSSKLVWGNWWRSFLIMGPLMAMSYGLGFFANKVISNQNWPVLAFVMIAGSLFYPFFYACIVSLFSDLKVRRKLAIAEIVEKASTK